MSKRLTRRERILRAKPRYCWVFVAAGGWRSPATIYWTTAAATEQICRATNRQYHDAGWDCVRVKVSVAAKQRAGRMPNRLRRADWKDIGRRAWKRPGCSQGGEWVWKEKK